MKKLTDLADLHIEVTQVSVYLFNVNSFKMAAPRCLGKLHVNTSVIN